MSAAFTGRKVVDVNKVMAVVYAALVDLEVGHIIDGYGRWEAGDDEPNEAAIKAAVRNTIDRWRELYDLAVTP